MEVDRLSSQIDLETKDRDKGLENIDDKLSAEMNRIDDLINIETKVREETQSTLERLIDDMERNLTRDI